MCSEYTGIISLVHQASTSTKLRGVPKTLTCDDVTVSFEDSSVVLSTDARGCQPCAHACQVPSLLVALIISDS